MSEILAKVYRGNIVESVHRGYISVVDSSGKVIFKKGDINKVTYIRSSAKPIQALNVILSGAYDYYKLNQKELALICSSHFAEKKHIDTLKGIFKKIGISTDKLKCGEQYSRKKEIAFKQAYKKFRKSQLFCDCSGKHAGFLSVCELNNLEYSSYLNRDHPVQNNIKKIFSYICKVKKKDLTIGIDGCSAPVFALPIYNMAFGYSRLADIKKLKKPYREAVIKIFDAINKYPFLIAGSNGFCTEFNKNTDKDLIGKIGAEGVFCIADRKNNLGIAIKIEDGNSRPIPMIVYRLLNILKFNEKRFKKLEKYKEKTLQNNANIEYGRIKAVY